MEERDKDVKRKEGTTAVKENEERTEKVKTEIKERNGIIS
jgi:hypothetical protein